jgi:hypothetical protein
MTSDNLTKRFGDVELTFDASVEDAVSAATHNLHMLAYRYLTWRYGRRPLYS